MPAGSAGLASGHLLAPQRAAAELRAAGKPAAGESGEWELVAWPAEDLAGYVDGEAHPIALHQDGWQLRDYQQQAVQAFWAGGSGVVVLPCGAGKTLVGAAAMARAKATTLILVTNTVAGRQWKRELIARTSLTEEEIGEYSGERKEIRPVTIATYQVLTTRRGGVFAHLDLFGARDWGLVSRGGCIRAGAARQAGAAQPRSPRGAATARWRAWRAG